MSVISQKWKSKCVPGPIVSLLALMGLEQASFQSPGHLDLDLPFGAVRAISGLMKADI